jgi:hypothetical protein
MKGGWRLSWGDATPSHRPVKTLVKTVRRKIPVAKLHHSDPLENLDQLHPGQAFPLPEPPARKSALRPLPAPRKELPSPKAPRASHAGPKQRTDPAGALKGMVVVSRSADMPVFSTSAKTSAEEAAPAQPARQARKKVSQDSGWEEDPMPVRPVPVSPAAVRPAPPVTVREGMVSVLAAQDVPADPPPTGSIPSVPADEGNAFGGPPPARPRGVPPRRAAYPPQGMMPPPGMGMPFPPPHMPPPAVRMGPGAGAANAFTQGGTSRPIPADFAAPTVAANAFSDASPHLLMGAPGMAPPVQGMPPMPGGMPPAAGYPAAVHQRRSMWPTGASVEQLLTMLGQELSPSLRAWAADRLSRIHWQGRPDVVEALRRSAAKDPAPQVRVACVGALSSMGVRTAPVLQTVQALQKDGDPKVRQAAAEALEGMTK